MEQDDLNLERSAAKHMVVYHLEKGSTWNEAAPKGKVGSMESHRRCLAQHVGVFGQRAPSTVVLLPCPPTAGHLSRDWNSPVPKIAQCLRSLAAWRLHVAHGTVSVSLRIIFSEMLEPIFVSQVISHKNDLKNKEGLEARRLYLPKALVLADPTGPLWPGLCVPVSTVPPGHLHDLCYLLP